MLGRRGARAERGMPRGWTALCLLSLLREYPPRAARQAGRGGPSALSQLHGGKGPLPPSKLPRPWPLPALGSEGRVNRAQPLTWESAGLGRGGKATTPRV